MGKSKDDLSLILKEILGSDKVYNSPPSRLGYPCILYQRDDIKIRSADNIKYIKHTAYTLTYMTYRSDEKVVDDILSLPMCSFDREYTADNIKHIVFNIYW